MEPSATWCGSIARRGGKGASFARSRGCSRRWRCAGRRGGLGGRVDVCRSCGFERPAYNSVPVTGVGRGPGAPAREVDPPAHTERLLRVSHFHVVFTLPSELRALTQHAPRGIFGAVLSAASDTLLELGQRWLGARPRGHEWCCTRGRASCAFGEGVHALVTAGGLAQTAGAGRAARMPASPWRSWARCCAASCSPRCAPSTRAAPSRAFQGFVDPEAFDRLMAKLARAKRWNSLRQAPLPRASTTCFNT